jgi:hypothetical protein
MNTDYTPKQFSKHGIHSERFTSNKRPLDKQFNPENLKHRSGLRFHISPGIHSKHGNKVSAIDLFLPSSSSPYGDSHRYNSLTVPIYAERGMAIKDTKGTRDGDQNEEMRTSLTGLGSTETMTIVMATTTVRTEIIFPSIGRTSKTSPYATWVFVLVQAALGARNGL